MMFCRQHHPFKARFHTPAIRRMQPYKNRKKQYNFKSETGNYKRDVAEQRPSTAGIFLLIGRAKPPIPVRQLVCA
jgi:hypothetical protein